MIAIATLATVFYLKTVQGTNLFLSRELESGVAKVKRFGSNESVVLYVMGNIVSQGILTDTTLNMTRKVFYF